MKAAVVLIAENPSLRQQAGEINAIVKNLATELSSMELWLFYRGNHPEFFPEFDCALSSIKLIATEQDHLPESYLQALQQVMDQAPVDLLLFGSDGLGAELATRLSYRLGGSSCLQVEDCNVTSEKLEVIKPVYGNNLAARLVLEFPPYCLSVAKQPCRPAKMVRRELPKTEILTSNPPRYNWVKETLTIPDQSDTGLADADRVLVVGQGAKNKQTVDALQSVAKKIGAELGASRPVVMNGWADMNRLIGASGLILSPKLCLAAGVSGTAVFSVGIKSSEFIVAINTDAQAPIFQIADVGIVGDLQAVLSELEKVITAEKSKQGTA
jgi:electron transfer flavoprotein alpha subunit